MTTEQLQIASLIAARVQELASTGSNDVTIFAEMADYMPGFKRLLDTSTRSEMDALCQSQFNVRCCLPGIAMLLSLVFHLHPYGARLNRMQKHHG